MGRRKKRSGASGKRESHSAGARPSPVGAKSSAPPAPLSPGARTARPNKVLLAAAAAVEAAWLVVLLVLALSVVLSPLALSLVLLLLDALSLLP